MSISVVAVTTFAPDREAGLDPKSKARGIGRERAASTAVSETDAPSSCRTASRRDTPHPTRATKANPRRACALASQSREGQASAGGGARRRAAGARRLDGVASAAVRAYLVILLGDVGVVVALGGGGV